MTLVLSRVFHVTLVLHVSRVLYVTFVLSRVLYVRWVLSRVLYVTLILSRVLNAKLVLSRDWYYLKFLLCNVATITCFVPYGRNKSWVLYLTLVLDHKCKTKPAQRVTITIKPLRSRSRDAFTKCFSAIKLLIQGNHSQQATNTTSDVLLLTSQLPRARHILDILRRSL